MYRRLGRSDVRLNTIKSNRHAAFLASIVLATATGLAGVRIVLVKLGLEGRLAVRAAGIFMVIGWPIQREK